MPALASLLPAFIKKSIKRQLSVLDNWLVGVLQHIPSLSGLYYLCNGRYGAQQRNNLAARHLFIQQSNGSNARSGYLRRHIHRLEKGLIMCPRKPIFAVDYIMTTVTLFEIGLREHDWDPSEIDWATAVLDEYFKTTYTHIEIQRAYDVYLKCLSEHKLTIPNSRPYPAGTRSLSPVSFEQLTTLTKQRRSVRWFSDTPVDIKTIEQAIEVATQAPSACNRQSFKYITFTKPEDARRVGAIAGGTSGFVAQLQALLVVVGDWSAYPFERDRHVVYIDASLANMQLMLALETLGLSSCPINWADEPVAEKKMQQELLLPPEQRVIMLIALGYPKPDGKIALSHKKSIAQLMDIR